MNINDTVRFTRSVVRRCACSPHVAGMIGTVVAINGSLATVDTHGTYRNTEGCDLRHIPVSNLEVVIIAPLPKGLRHAEAA